MRLECLFLTVSLYLSHVLDKNLHFVNDLAEMRKQRKMGHVTIVGPSMGEVEERLRAILMEECCDSPSAG